MASAAWGSGCCLAKSSAAWPSHELAIRHEPNRSVEKLVAGSFENGDHLFSFNARKTFEKVFDGIAGFEMIEQAANGDARSFEYRRTAEGLRVNRDQAIVHNGKLAHKLVECNRCFIEPGCATRELRRNGMAPMRPFH